MRYLLPAVVFFVVVIIAAHFFAPPGYQISQNTISDLGSQGHVKKWIMQTGFIGFGLLVLAGIVWKSIDQGSISGPDLAILVYGLSILVTGFFCAAPILEGIQNNIPESRIHSLFATTAGVALIGAITWILFRSGKDWSVHFFFLISITAISIAFGLAENDLIPIGKGLVQRFLYLVSFIWLVFYLV